MKWYGDLGRELWECEGGTLRGDAEGVLNSAPFVCNFDGVVGKVWTYKAGGIGGVFWGNASMRYGCSRHCRLVSRASESYLRRSDMHSTSFRGMLRSKQAKMSFG